MYIRDIKENDIDDILRLIEDSYKPYEDLIKDISIPVYTGDEIKALLDEPHSDAWVAVEDDEIVGIAAGTEFGPCAYHLKMMFVSGQAQHKGIGRALLEKFEKSGAERHHSLYTANYLGWAAWSGQFYKKHGYREYVAEDVTDNQDLKSQADFLREIGRLNNGDKHLIWKTGS